MAAALISAMTLALAAGCAAVWWRHWTDRTWPLALARPSRPFPFGLLDLVSLFLCLVLADSLAAVWLHSQGVEIRVPGRVLPPLAQWVLSIGRLAAVAVWSAGTVAARGISLLEWLVEHWHHLRRDVLVGLLMFVRWVPLILLLQMVSVSLVQYEHPALKQLQELRDWTEILPVLLATVVTAPLVEEILFRGLLLRWLDRIVVERPTWLSLLMGGWLATAAEEEGDDTAGESDSEGVTQRWGAIIASSLVFASLHLGNGPGGSTWGPDIVPLFLFACVLGWVTRHTNRLTPAIVMHMLLNGYSTIALLASKVPT